ncbi:MAG: flagellar biosynthetic protein FliP, partial [Planctomycetota bacterium]
MLIGLAVAACLTLPAVGWAQEAEPLDPFNPLSILENADAALPFGSAAEDAGGQGSGDGSGDNSRSDSGGGLSASLSIILLLTVLSLAPAILVMCTSFTRIIVVLALLRQAVGTQALPPSQVLVGLSLFMTVLIMMPTFERINEQALQPLQAGQIDQLEAWNRTKQPLRDF